MSVVPIIDVTKCDGCGECVDACHANAVEIVNGKAVVVRPGDCDYCTDCESLCPKGAISCPLEIVVLEKPVARGLRR
ncbi:MAG: 4Fe-4S binding protein [Dehalococcoidia bacterium]|nr:4Fe-4S binding protein [Dehalococcoidia bacterium]